MKQKNEGYALLVVMLVMLGISILGTVLFRYTELSGIQALRKESDHKALWAVESALGRLKARLENGGNINDHIADLGIVQINGFDCELFAEADDDNPFIYTVYSTTTNKLGRPIQIAVNCINAPLSRYAWGAYNAGAWQTWGQDSSGGISGVNANERAINWGNDTIGGPFFTYDILTAEARNGLLKFGTAEVIDFHLGDGEDLRRLRAEKLDELTNNVALAWIHDTNPSQYPLAPVKLPEDEAIKVLIKRSNTSGNITNADYNHVVDDTVMDRARKNYNNLWNDNSLWIEPGFAGVSSPTNVYKIDINNNQYTITKGKVYFEASLTKGNFEKRRSFINADDEAWRNRLRFYMDLNNNFINNGASYTRARDIPNVFADAINAITLAEPDLPIFLDIKFEDYRIGDLDYLAPIVRNFDANNNNIIVARGDVFIEGVVDGNLTIVGADNVYISEDEVVYAYPANHSWQTWHGGRLVALPSGADLLDALENDFINTQNAARDWMNTDNRHDDLLTVFAGRQVIMLGDDQESDDANCHGAYLMVNDVDPEFGHDFEYRLEPNLLTEINRHINASGFAKGNPQLTDVPIERIQQEFPLGRHQKMYFDGANWHLDLNNDGTFTNSGSNIEIRSDLRGYFHASDADSTSRTNALDNCFDPYNVVPPTSATTLTYTMDETPGICLPSIELVRKRPVNAHSDNPANYRLNSLPRDRTWGITDCFYKDYVTTGMAPWDKHVKTDSKGFIYGGLLEYRHSRFIPGGGLSRKFLYDWRLGTQRTPGVATDRYLFTEWRQNKGNEIFPIP